MERAQNQEILHDFSPLLRAYKDGHVERLIGQELSPASLDSDTGVLSKDILIDAKTNLSARLYLPKDAGNTAAKLPLLIYFHGGAFVVASAFSTPYHRHLNLLTAKAYRLAPEHPIPAAYDDAWHALKWVVTNEEINRYANLSRVFLGGDSAGANIAHNVAMRYGVEKMKGIELAGMFFNCPFFCGEEALGDEENHPMFPKKYFDDLWRLVVCPGTIGSDDPWINPSTDAKLGGLGCMRVLVYTAEMDPMKERAWLYKEALEKSGWDGKIEGVEVKGEGHIFSVYDPMGENGVAMMTKVATFINN